MDAEVTMELSQITHPKSQDQKRKTHEGLRRPDTKQPLFHRATELRKTTANPRCPMLKSRLSSQFIAPDGIDNTRKVTEVKENQAPNLTDSRIAIQAAQSRKPKQLPVKHDEENEQVTAHT